MLARRRCVVCDCREVLVVRTIRDRAVVADRAVLALEATLPEPLLRAWTNWGIFLLVACRSCGYAEWYVNQPELVRPDPPLISTRGGTCFKCGGRDLLDAAVRDKVGSTDAELEPLCWNGRRLEVTVCLDCCRCEWWAPDLAGLGSGTGSGGCRRCGKADFTAFGTVSEKRAPGDAEPLGVDPEHPLRTRACRACARLDWSVPMPGTVFVDGARVVLLQGPPDTGPYR